MPPPKNERRPLQQPLTTPATRKRQWLLWVTVAVLGLAAVLFYKRPVYHPEIVIQSGQLVQMSLIKQPYNSLARCEQAVERLATNMTARCPDCEYRVAHCITKLSPRQQQLLQGQSIDMPSLRIARGAIGFESTTPELALATCQQAAQQAGGLHRCTPAGSSASATPLAGISELQLDFKPTPQTLLLLTLWAAAVSCLICGFLVASERWHARFSHDAVDAGPQKFHTRPVPRIGGIGIACALGLTLLALDMADLLMTDSVYAFALLALAALPAFIGGLAEDLTKKVGVLARLLLTMAAGALASVLTGATLTSLDIPGLDALLQWSPLIAVAFTAVAVAGVANAFNIIDGYNGLASGFALLALSALAWVAFKVADQVVLITSLTMLGAVLGFMCWNWPGGRIFLGDGGAYLIGFWLAELSILLVVRNPEVSPWLPLAVLIYPVWETVFSMYRRKILSDKATGSPDAEHLHQMIFFRLRQRTESRTARKGWLKPGNLVAPWIWLTVLPFLFFSTVIFKNTFSLILAAGLFVAVYLFMYASCQRGRRNQQQA